MSMDNVVLLNPRTPREQWQSQDPLDLAVRDCEMAAADFMVAILDAKSVDRALTLHRRLEAVIAILNAVSSSAMDKANSF